MKLSDYLHLYLGCEGIKTAPDGISYGTPDKLTPEELHKVLYNGYDFKPLLRPLSDMTAEEIIQMFLLRGLAKPDKILRTGIEERFMQIAYEHSGAYGSDFQHLITLFPEQTVYLLSKHFDLFGLIEQGLAIDKTKVHA